MSKLIINRKERVHLSAPEQKEDSMGTKSGPRKRNRNRGGGGTPTTDNARLLLPTTPLTLVPGHYVMRNGLKAHVSSKEGQYAVGYKHTPNGRKSWRWFLNGESYGNCRWDDIVQS